ncbi:BNR-4 repeat-containing protein [Salinimicrobium sp. 3283s]|uniref:BNR-4 repeat-containing protein n=1 Tax=Salinimicrobium sp. 3283s TaxID=3114359 RepID=UPI0031EA07AC
MINPFFHSLLSLTNEVRDVTEVGESLAYTWFGRPNYAYSEEAQKYWIGSTKDIAEGTTQHITEYDITEDTYTTTRVGTVFEKDDHNQVQIVIRSSDKRLLVFYSEHVGNSLRYRISTNPLDSSSFGEEKLVPGGDAYKFSYPSPYQASNGDIFVFWRFTPPSIEEEWYYAKSTDGGETWNTSVKLYATGYRAYLVSSQDGDKIHFFGNNGHPEINNDLNINCYHFSFDLTTETAYNSVGTSIALPVTPPFATQVNSAVRNDTSWILDVTTKNNLPRVLFVFYPQGRANDFLTKELWLSVFNGTEWINTLITTTLSGYIEDDASVQESAYPGASRFDSTNPDIIFMPKEVNGILEIFKVDISVSPIYFEQLTFDSEVHNWRPISVPSPVNNLLWLKNNDYNMWNDYDISLQTKTVQV